MEQEEPAGGTIAGIVEAIDGLPDGHAAAPTVDQGDVWPDVFPGPTSADLERLADTLERLRCTHALVEVDATEIVTSGFVLERSFGSWWVCTKGEDGRNCRVPGNPDDGFETAVAAWRWASDREADKSADPEN